MLEEHTGTREHYLVREKERDLPEQVDLLRLHASRKLERSQKAEAGQFLTPAPLARFMASLLQAQSSSLRILDAGAGVGSLFAACVADLCMRKTPPKQIHVVAYEIDAKLIAPLQETLRLCRSACEQAGIVFIGEVRQEDFLAAGVELLQDTLFASHDESMRFHCAILNPPYKKIQTQSRERKLLQRVGIESSNLYAGFLALAAQLLEPSGELIAITPRSFCNGPYFKNFREQFLRMMALNRLHVFDSRRQAFSEDDVLQENIILHAVKAQEKPGSVLISSSTGPDDEYMLMHEVEYSQVVQPNDPQLFIRIVQDHVSESVVQQMERFQTSLADLGIAVSTGRVVDFRSLDFLQTHYEPGTVPLLFPTHVGYGSVVWPKYESKKPHALLDTVQTKSLQIPNGYYVLVKRFTAKEEKKRLVAALYNPIDFPGASIAFENHLNYFHCNGKGLDPALARGLAAYLNSTLVDAFFRLFNGHTQVNATDLRNIKYPTLRQLESLGKRIGAEFPAQSELDELVKKELLSMEKNEPVGVRGRDPVQLKQKIDEALSILKVLELPRSQQNERSALTLLALLGLKPDMPWSQAGSPLCGITPMMDFFREHYGKSYKPNTRETVRRQTVHQFLEAGLIVINPDDPARPPNSAHTVYQIEQGTLDLLRTFGTPAWETHLQTYLASVETLKKRYAQERDMHRIPVTVASGKVLTLSPGGQNVLIERIIHVFAPLYIPGGEVLYIGDTDEKFAYFDEEGFADLGIRIDPHGKIPDVIIYYTEKNWLVLIEAVTSHGPIDGKRKDELRRLFQNSKAGLVFVTAFLTRSAMVRYLQDISWETEVWVADHPTHLIHFDGEHLLGPDGN
jgi:adenine-specific DNA-methyltransferase